MEFVVSVLVAFGVGVLVSKTLGAKRTRGPGVEGEHRSREEVLLSQMLAQTPIEQRPTEAVQATDPVTQFVRARLLAGLAAGDAELVGRAWAALRFYDDCHRRNTWLLEALQAVVAECESAQPDASDAVLVDHARGRLLRAGDANKRHVFADGETITRAEFQEGLVVEGLVRRWRAWQGPPASWVDHCATPVFDSTVLWTAMGGLDRNDFHVLKARLDAGAEPGSLAEDVKRMARRVAVV